MIRVLLLAYACEPDKGSEPGIGWNWAIHLSKFANVTVITRANNRFVIEDKLSKERSSSPLFIYFDIPIIKKIKTIIPFGIQLYNLLWEFFVIKRINKGETYSLIHRVTFGSTFSCLRLYKLNGTYIHSFVAGGESAPKSISERYSSMHKFIERMRMIYNSAYKWFPVTKKLYDNSRLVLSVTQETSRFITSLGYKGKTKIVPAIGIGKITGHAKSKSECFNLVYAGRLIYWKNVDVLVKAMKGISVDNIAMDIYGDGKEKRKLQKLASMYGLEASIKFHGNIRRDVLLGKISGSHLFLFASSHDSGGMAILEAVSLKIPVLILDTGGPSEIFRGLDYPLKVNPDQSYDKIVGSFKEKIEWLHNNYNSFYDDFLEVRRKVLERFNWDNKAKQMVELYEEILNENSASS